ncbi:TetR/AcrR family transcriptional regulator [Corynebacterium sp. A21]|uniref:TetR/AcrR family transcriptional regulator n=1 Tax=Corynebacterium sp. A21 TaxID=3457318 RepID=UPI003FD3199E
MNTVNTKSYHHGNLRAEMVRIGVELAAEGGPEAVSLREAARRAGVSPAAAYRHFSDKEGLIEAVRTAAAEALGRSIRAEVEQAPENAPAERILSAGRGYFNFALDQPLLFKCLASGFTLPEKSSRENPFEMLRDLVGEYLGATPDAADRARQFAAAVALWSAAHGISVLCSSGTLRKLTPENKRELMEETLANAVRGLNR